MFKIKKLWVLLPLLIAFLVAGCALQGNLPEDENKGTTQMTSVEEEEEDTTVTSKDNLEQIYCLALDSFMLLDEALNHEMKYIAIDTTTMADITEEGRKQILDFFKKYGVEVMDASMEKLKEEGLFDENKLCLEGILLRIESIDFEPGDRVVIKGSKYRSGTGAIGVISTLTYEDGNWELIEANITWIS